MPEPRIFVAKIGSNSLVDREGRLDAAFLKELAGQITRTAAAAGWRPVIVTSGAVAGGICASRPGRAAARPARAPGPGCDRPDRAGPPLGGGAARAWLSSRQLLLTHGDFSDRERNQNLTATVRALFAFGAVPVINENDPIATPGADGRRQRPPLGPGRRQLGAEVLVLLTDIDGVYDADPRSSPHAKRISEIPTVTAAVLAAAGGASARGRGGMRSKIEGARLAAASGVATVIAAAREREVITQQALPAGDDVGARVGLGRGDRVDARRRWLAVARRVKGRVHVDAGAVAALTQRGKSLLPAGVLRVEGRFAVGETVGIVGPDGLEVARGLASIASDELERIAGKRSDVAASELGHALPKAAVHRDDLLVLAR